MTDSHASLPLTPSREKAAHTRSGYLMILVSTVLMGLFAASVYYAVLQGGSLASVLLSILMFFVWIIGSGNPYILKPNQAAVLTRFGTYMGTDRNEGLRWTWLWNSAEKISLRANNLISEKIKVNDLRGNPIEIAAQVVWRVTDTAQALFDVDDYKEFVMAQIEAAIRAIGSRYPYDDIEHKEITLRGNHDEVGAELKIALTERLAVAGISVDECGLTHLAYAQEIAGSMLRRQQAQAVVSARHTLVEGAVGMVEMALAKLSERQVVDLDDERKAAMVSNLMVVLCGERDTQPVVNTGTLYQ